MSSDERASHGAMGQYGAMGCNDRELEVVIKFSMSKIFADNLPTQLFKVTPNNGVRMRTISTLCITDQIKCIYGVYKRLGFDTAYIAIKAMKTALTEIEFCTSNGDNDYGESVYDDDLVTIEQYKGTEDLVCLVDGYRDIDTGMCSVYLRFLGIDAVTNLENIKIVLLSVCGSRDQSLLDKYHMQPDHPIPS